MGPRARRTLAAVAVTTLLLAGYESCWRGVVPRWTKRVADHAYRRELCAPAGPPQAPSRQYSDPAPGSGYVASPDGRFLALSREAAWAYHTVYVWDEQEHRLHAVMSIQEGDPGSGRAHDYRWSGDSRALFITGWGSLPLRASEQHLAYIYVVDEDAVYKVPACG